MPQRRPDFDGRRKSCDRSVGPIMLADERLSRGRRGGCADLGAGLSGRYRLLSGRRTLGHLGRSPNTGFGVWAEKPHASHQDDRSDAQRDDPRQRHQPAAAWTGVLGVVGLLVLLSLSDGRRQLAQLFLVAAQPALLAARSCLGLLLLRPSGTGVAQRAVDEGGCDGHDGPSQSPSRPEHRRSEARRSGCWDVVLEHDLLVLMLAFFDLRGRRQRERGGRWQRRKWSLSRSLL